MSVYVAQLGVGKRYTMAKITAFVVLCSLVTSTRQGDSTYKGESSQQCGKLIFNAHKYTCCRSDIHEGSHLACCGTSAYNVLNSSCCNGHVTHGLGQGVSDCCATKAYNPVNQICCGEVIRNRPGARAQCCTSEVIDEETHLCCAATVRVKETVFHRCCGNNLYDNRTQCCCSSFNLTVENRSNSTCCQMELPQADSQTKQMSQPQETKFIQKHQMDTGAHTESPCCGSHMYNQRTHVCCSGYLYTKKSSLTQCCGAEVYQLWEEGSLCCDGVLYRDQPAGSMCSGETVYSPHRYTVCQGHVHLPAGQQCCGRDPFNPREEICCRGRRHRLAESVICCGSDIYNPNIPGYKCCSGHLYDLTGAADQSEAECCGPLLLRKNQRCCQSTEKTLTYEAQKGHSCCGHWYYNMSLWDCCAGRLVPLTRHSRDRERHEFRLIPHLSDYNISSICRETVLLGTVLSEAVNQTLRSVVLTDVLQMYNATLTPLRPYHKVIYLDHCSFPELEAGRTYLWRVNGSEFMPVTNLTAVASSLHSILTHCSVLCSEKQCYPISHVSKSRPAGQIRPVN